MIYREWSDLKGELMNPQKIDKAISTSVLSSINGLLTRVVVFLSRSMLNIVGVVRRIRTGSIASQHHNELIKIANLKQSEIHSQTLEENRSAEAFDKQVLRQCVLDGEQQAKCFTLALLFVVFVGLIIVRLTSIN
jgi:hypothetical protein